MHAIQLAIDAIAGAGDEVIHLSPAWPNFAAAAGVAGAAPVAVTLDHSSNGWSCDVDRIAAAITPRTRALFLVSPSNPTGWTATIDDLKATLALARKHGLWIIADETYARFWYGEGSRAPSYFDVMEPEDRILFVNTFSKNWAMTGWRVGWITAHPSLGQVIENLVQYSTSGVAQFMQRAAITAIEQGEDFVATQIARAREGRDITAAALTSTGRCRFALPDGAFYMFFKVDGEKDMRRLAFRLIDEAKVGLAPGTAFGAGGEEFLRLCFARDAGQVREAADAVAKVLMKG
jgi:aspartate/methionine/tyrosine aminotransferase